MHEAAFAVDGCHLQFSLRFLLSNRRFIKDIIKMTHVAINIDKNDNG